MTSTLVSAGSVVGAEADSVLFKRGKIEAVGFATVLQHRAERTVNYDHGVIVPGLIDVHFHPLGHVADVTGLTLKRALDFDELARLVRHQAGRQAPGQTVVGLRLDDESLAERRLPNRYDLDRWLTDRPVVLYRYCGHVAVANTAALEAAGIGPDTTDPDGGYFDRDQSGNPNGIVREWAIQMLTSRLNTATTSLDPAVVLGVMNNLAAEGLTGLGAIASAGEPIWCGVGDELSTLLDIAPESPLDLSVLVIASNPVELTDAAKRLQSAGPHISFLGWKSFSDGSLGGHTAAMHEPFTDRPDKRGTVRLDWEKDREMAMLAQELGGWVAVHAIGDRANDMVLDFFSQLIDDGADPTRLRVEHASVLTDAAVARMAALGVTASVQPAFLASENDWLAKRLGPERLPRAYPFRSMLEAGIPLAGGSDCPVEPPSPWWGIAAARERGGLTPSEALNPEQALSLFTTGAARAVGELEPLQSGSPANFLVIDQDPHNATTKELLQTEILARWFWGEVSQLPA